MRSIVLGVLLALGLAITGTVAAQAATTSVEGTGSYKKLTVNNGKNTLVFRAVAPGGKCVIKYLHVKFRDRDGTTYSMDGGCYPGGVWAASLSRGSKLVDCPTFTLKYGSAKKRWTGTIPRSCLGRLGAAVKVTDSYVDDYSPMPGEVPATKYVAQG